DVCSSDLAPQSDGGRDGSVRTRTTRRVEGGWPGMVTRRAAVNSARYAANFATRDPVVPLSALLETDAPVLVFGASGQVGEAVVRRLLESGRQVVAVSREVRDGPAGVTWLQGSLDAPPPVPAGVGVVFSCGPLDAFARWYARAVPGAHQVVAFGSTSAETKSHSGHADERALAGRLLQAEHTVLETAARRGAAA